MDQFEPQAGDPLHEPGEGCLIGQLGAQGGDAQAYIDLAVVEFRAQCRARFTRESDLVSSCSHYGQPRSPPVQRAVSLPGGRVIVITHPGVIRSALSFPVGEVRLGHVLHPDISRHRRSLWLPPRRRATAGELPWQRAWSTASHRVRDSH
jgi:hypothetical protein